MSDCPDWGRSPERRFRLLIVGGGPAGCSVLVRAARLGLFADLCGNSHTVNDRANVACSGVCVIDAQPQERFGGGKLQDYVINSNTNADKFVSNVVEEKPNMLPPESVCGSSRLSALASSPAAQALEAIGPHTGPLRDIGLFLRHVGAAVAADLSHFPNCKTLHSTQVVRVSRLADKKEVNGRARTTLVSPAADASSGDTDDAREGKGEREGEGEGERGNNSVVSPVLEREKPSSPNRPSPGQKSVSNADTQAKPRAGAKAETTDLPPFYWRVECATPGGPGSDLSPSSVWGGRTGSSDSSFPSASAQDDSNAPQCTTVIYAQEVIFATGGTQTLPRPRSPGTFLSPMQLKRTMCSDTFLTRAGIHAACARLLAVSPARRRVVVIGGSHSGT